jgi:hypothetical protein
MDRGRVGEDRGSKETDGCPLTDSVCSSLSYLPVHQHSLLDLSPFRYSLWTAETMPMDGNSMA